MHSKERVSIRSSVKQVLLVLTLQCHGVSNALDDRRTSHICCRKPLWSLQTLFVPGISYVHPLERHLWRKRWLRRWVWRKSWSVLWRWEQKTIMSRLFFNLCSCSYHLFLLMIILRLSCCSALGYAYPPYLFLSSSLPFFLFLFLFISFCSFFVLVFNSHLIVCSITKSGPNNKLA